MQQHVLKFTLLFITFVACLGFPGSTFTRVQAGPLNCIIDSSLVSWFDYSLGNAYITTDLAAQRGTGSGFTANANSGGNWPCSAGNNPCYQMNEISGTQWRWWQYQAYQGPILISKTIVAQFEVRGWSGANDGGISLTDSTGVFDAIGVKDCAGSGGGSGTLRFGHNSNGGSRGSATDTAAGRTWSYPGGGLWKVHGRKIVAVTYDVNQAQTSQTITTYVEGELIGTVTTSSIAIFNPAVSPVNLLFGGWTKIGDVGNANLEVLEVRVYNRALKYHELYPTRTATQSKTDSASPKSSATASVAPSATSSVVPSQSTSLALTFSPTLLATMSSSKSGTKSIPASNSLSPSVTSTRGSFTLSPSPTIQSTESPTMLPTESVSGTGTPSSTRTITPPPTPTATVTPTRSIAPTASTTVTDTLTYTFTMSSSGTMSVTPSGKTFSRTGTYSQSASQEIYCGGKFLQDCLNVPKFCTANDEGLCFSTNCTSKMLADQKLCIQMGCDWISNTCRRPKGCNEMFTIEACSLRPACRWSKKTGTCSVDTTPCEQQDTKEDCLVAECSWNFLLSPRCFRPILSPSLCRLVTTPTLCSAQNCLWMDVNGGFCEAWDANCTTIFPHVATCPQVAECFYAAGVCVSLADTSFDMLYAYVIGADLPQTVFPGEEFNALFYGSSLAANVSVFFIPSGEPCPSPSATQEQYKNVSFAPTYYDRLRKGSLVAQAWVNQQGNYSACIRANATHVLGPFGNVSVRLTLPSLKECLPQYDKLYSNEVFSVALKGEGLDPRGKVAIVNQSLRVLQNNGSLLSLNLSSVCANVSLKSYVPISVFSAASSTSMHEIADRGSYALCYINRVEVPASCPRLLSVLGTPPWLDKVVLSASVMPQLPLVAGRTLEAFNGAFCKSMAAGNNTFGIHAHPSSMKIDFGDGVKPYFPSEVCVAAIAPMKDESYAPHPSAIVLDVYLLSMNPEDDVRLFLPVGRGADPMPSCDNAATKEPCVKQGCTWDPGSGDAKGGKSCSVVRRVIDNCPDQISGYSLVRVLTYESFQAAEKQWTLPLPINGAILAFCAKPTPKRGIGAQMQYRVQETWCQNDCKDSFGTSHGECLYKGEVGRYECNCATGYSGADCSRRVVCRGAGSQAETIAAPYGADAFAMSSSACGFNFVLDPSLASMERMARYSVGFRIFGVRMSNPDCQSSYIEIRQRDWKGSVVKRLCQSDILAPTSTTTQASSSSASVQGATDNGLSQEVYRALLENHHGIYVEFKSDEGDVLSIEYTSVSLVCPGLLGSDGLPAREDECDARGTCASVEYTKEVSGTTLSRFAKQCLCNVPYAASYIGSSCNTCGFGYLQRSFPACEPATVCAQNCTGHGDCLPGIGCLCHPGFYGLDCQLVDDADRLGYLASSLEVRIPLNAKDAGNVISSGKVDRTFLPCALPGSYVQCEEEERDTGRQYDKGGSSSSSWSVVDLGFRRRQQSGNTTSPSGNATNETSASGNRTEVGVQFNAITANNVLPDFVRMDNITGTMMDLQGEFTVASWVKVTAQSHGFLVAKVDSFFTAEGMSLVLPSVLTATKDRFAKMSELSYVNATTNCYFAIALNGQGKRVDVFVSDPSHRGAYSTKEDWFFARHFRLGKKAGDLFDGTWRHIALSLSDKGTSWIMGQAFVDGYTEPGRPGFVQCLPFLPVASQSNALNATHVRAKDPRIVVTLPGSSLLWSYLLIGSLDELQIFSKELKQRDVVSVGGDEFLNVLLLPENVLLAMAFVSFIAVGIFLCAEYAARKRIRLRDEANDMRRAKQIADEEERNAKREQFFRRAVVKTRGNSNVSSPVHNKQPKPGENRVVMTATVEEPQRQQQQQLDLSSIVLASQGVFNDDYSHQDLEGNDASAIALGGIEDREEKRHAHADATSPVLPFDEDQLRSPQLAVGTNNGGAIMPDGQHQTEILKDSTQEDVYGSQQQQHNHQSSARVVTLFRPSSSNAQQEKQSADATKNVYKDGGEEEEEEEEEDFDPDCMRVIQETWRSKGRELTHQQLRAMMYVADQVNDSVAGEEKGDNTTEIQYERKIHGLLSSVFALAGGQSSKGKAVGMKQDAATEGEMTSMQMMHPVKQDHHSINGKIDAGVVLTSLHLHGSLDETEYEAYANATTFAAKAREERRKISRLEEISELVNLEIEMLRRKKDKRANDDPKRVKSATDAPSGASVSASEGAGASATIGLETSQVMSQVAVNQALPLAWVGIFSIPVTFMALDFGGLGILSFGTVFYTLGALSVIVELVIIFLVLTSEFQTQEELVLQLEKLITDRKAHLEQEEVYKPQRSAREKFIFIFAMLLALLYMPMTQYTMMGVFCHSRIQCEYDCYAETAHKNIVTVGIGFLVFTTLGTPLLYLLIIRRSVKQYHEYLGVYDDDLQRQHWIDFVSAVNSPLNSFYKKFHHDQVYAEIVILIYKATMTGFLTAMTQESVGQLCSVVVLQFLFVAFASTARPFVSEFANVLFSCCACYVVLFLGLQSFFLRDASKESIVGLVMIVATILILGFMVGIIMIELKKSFCPSAVDGPPPPDGEDDEAAGGGV